MDTPNMKRRGKTSDKKSRIRVKSLKSKEVLITRKRTDNIPNNISPDLTKSL